jgi:hypothetical protein
MARGRNSQASAGTTVRLERAVASAASLWWIGFDETRLTQDVVEGLRRNRQLGDLSRARTFHRLVLATQNAFGASAAHRLRDLRNVPREAGERQLRTGSVRVALEFLIRTRWPLGDFYSTPSGDMQCSWKLLDGARLVARFAVGDRVSYAVVKDVTIRLAGEDTESGFYAAVSHLRDQLLTEIIVAEAETFSPQVNENTFRLINTEPTQSGALLQPGSFGHPRFTYGSTLSTQATR